MVRRKKQKKKKVYTLNRLEEIMTSKQKVFCHEYIKDWNATRSAIAAGYSKKTACQLASETLRKPYISQYIEYVKDDIAKRAGLSKLLLMSELKKVALSSVADIYVNWITRKELEDIPKDVKDAIQEIDTKTVRQEQEDGEVLYIEYVKVKLYDKIKAIGDILKAMGWDKASEYEEKDNTIVLKFAGSVGMDEYTQEEAE